MSTCWKKCLLSMILFMTSGCSAEYVPITVRAGDGTEYSCDIVEKAGLFFSTLTKGSDSADLSLTLRGKVLCLGVNRSGKFLALGLLPMDGPNEFGHLYLGDTPQIQILETADFRVRASWDVRPPGMPASDPGKYARGITAFRRIAIDDDGARLATFYYKPRAEGGVQGAVTLWDAHSGKCLREFFAPEDAEPGRSGAVGVCGLGISPDANLLAFSGSWGRGLYSEPDYFLAVWRIDDGSCAIFRKLGHMALNGLCFDETGTRLAGWDTGYYFPLQVEVSVWGIPEGELIFSKRLLQRVTSIVWEPSGSVLRVMRANGPPTSLVVGE